MTNHLEVCPPAEDILGRHASVRAALVYETVSAVSPAQCSISYYISVEGRKRPPLTGRTELSKQAHRSAGPREAAEGRLFARSRRRPAAAATRPVSLSSEDTASLG